MNSKHYSEENQPTSIPKASQRLLEVKESIESITRQLESRKAVEGRLELQALREYQKWRDGAVTALQYTQAEEDFLIQWLKDNTEFDAVFTEAEVPLDFFETCVNQFSLKSLPPDVRTGNSRRDECVERMRQCDMFLIFLERTSMERKNRGINCADSYFSLRAKAVAAKSRIQTEVGFLKRWVREQCTASVLADPSFRSPASRVQILIEIIRRLMSEGSRLTDSELKIVNAIEQDSQGEMMK